MLTTQMIKENIAVAFVQEPYTQMGRVPRVTGSLSIHQFGAPTGRNKAAVITNNSLIKASVNAELTTENVVVCSITLRGVSCNIVSAYFEPHTDIDGYLNCLDGMFGSINPSNTLICVDANAKSTTWYNPQTDSRGRALETWIYKHDLYIMNNKNTPTFSSYQGESAIDLTLAGGSLLGSIQDWDVSIEDMLSDHNPVSFVLCADPGEIHSGPDIFHTKKANWKEFRRLLKLELKSKNVNIENVEEISDIVGINNAIDTLTHTIIKVSKWSMPYHEIGSQRNPWWNEDLRIKRNKLSAMRKRYIRCKSASMKLVHYQTYMQFRNEYKKLIKNTKTESWKRYCDIDNMSDVYKKIYRIFKTRRTTDREIGKLYTDQTTAIYNTKDIQEALLNKFFPDVSHALLNQEFNQNIDKPITMAELSYIMNNLNIKKAPGPDKLNNKIIEEVFKANKDLLLAVYNKCFFLQCFPKPWKGANVIFIDKKPEINNKTASNYRPICLLNSLGKIYEKILLNRLQYHVGDLRLLNERQHGFQKGKSIITACTQLRDFLVSARCNKKDVCLISLDIGGAFDSVNFDVVLDIMERTNIPGIYGNIVRDYFRNRHVNHTYKCSTAKREVGRGCPQGSVLGPFLWNLVMNALLLTLPYDDNILITAYADDLMVAIAGQGKQDIEHTATFIIPKIEKWTERCKLNINLTKSSTTYMTKKQKTTHPSIKITGQTIEYKTEIKYLGIIFDNKLNFFKHINIQNDKARRVLNQVSSAARQTWGLKNHQLLNLYKGIVEPIMIFGYQVWSQNISKKKIQILRRTQRLAAIRIVRAHRTISYISAFGLSGILPINYKLDILTRTNDCRTVNNIKINGKSYEIENTCESSRFHPAVTPILRYSKRIKPKQDYLFIYTDGSKLNGAVGCAFVYYMNDAVTYTQKFRLAPHCSVYQAELTAIHQALKRIKHLNLEPQTITVITDSDSGLKAIQNIYSTNPIVDKIHNSLHHLQRNKIYVMFSWTRAHQGLRGNEKADMLAKEATKCKQQQTYSKISNVSLKFKMESEARSSWEEEYMCSTRGTFGEFFPDYNTLKKFQSYKLTDHILTQFVTGHGRFKQYLHRFKLEASPICPCTADEEQTPRHLIFHCNTYVQQRTKFSAHIKAKYNMNWPFQLREITRSKEFIQDFAEFLHDVYSTL